MEKKRQNIIAYVMNLPAGAVESIRAYERETKQKFRVMLIWDTEHAPERDKKSLAEVDLFLKINLSDPSAIAEALAPYQEDMCAITCRSESYMARFIEVIPHVPYLRTPTTESLKWASDKLMMRRRFKLLAPKFNPKYTLVKANTRAEQKRIVKKIGFPLIVKPTNLAQSLLVTICYHEEELDGALKSTYKKIQKIYAENGRIEEPKIIVEEFMEGDMFSIDAYVNSRGRIYFCPTVKVVTGRNIGHDDFFNYLHLTPSGLKASSVKRAQDAAAAGIHALGLRNTSAHVELMKVDDEWKLIEIGARVGGFRDKLHRLSCGIDHSLNDILVRLPKKPRIPKKCTGFAATLKWYPKKEGVLASLKGIKKIKGLRSFETMIVSKKIGDMCTFAKNGGKAVFTVTLYNQERAKLLADIRRIEKSIDIQIS